MAWFSARASTALTHACATGGCTGVVVVLLLLLLVPSQSRAGHTQGPAGAAECQVPVTGGDFAALSLLE